MALMRVNIEKRTQAALTANQTATFAHGLAGAPDAVHIRFVATLASTTNWIGVNAVVDATNVTLQNGGATTSPAMEICAVRYHSLIQ